MTRLQKLCLIAVVVLKALREWLEVRPNARHDALWVTIRGAAPMGYPALEMMVRHLGEAAGVPNCTIHRFRHTFATEHYRANKDLIAVRNALGHESVEVTEKYLRALGLSLYQGDDASRLPDEWLADR